MTEEQRQYFKQLLSPQAMDTPSSGLNTGQNTGLPQVNDPLNQAVSKSPSMFWESGLPNNNSNISWKDGATEQQLNEAKAMEFPQAPQAIGTELSLDTTDIGNTVDPTKPTGQDKDKDKSRDYSHLFNTLGVSGYSTPYRAYKFGQFSGMKEGTKGKGLGMAASGLGALAGLMRQGMSGYGNMQKYENTMDSYNAAQKEREENYGTYYKGYDNMIGKDGGTFIPKFKNGGLFDSKSTLPEPEAVATGEYVFGLPKVMAGSANVEVEDGEYIKNHLNDVQLAVGETHSNGGVKLLAEDKLEILSDNLEVGSKVSKKYNKILGINSKKNSTFAGVLGKYTKSLGLDKLTGDQMKIFGQMEEQAEVKHEATAGLNLQYLSGKAVELEERRKPLEEKRVVLFDSIYQDQEDFKTTPDYFKIKIKDEEAEADKMVKAQQEFSTYKKSIL